MHNKHRAKRGHEEIVTVLLDEVFVPERTIERILRKDHAQIARMQSDFENDRPMVRVVLRPRFGGGYNVEDGRHRVIAAKLANAGYIEAIIVGNGGDDFGDDD